MALEQLGARQIYVRHVGCNLGAVRLVQLVVLVSPEQEVELYQFYLRSVGRGVDDLLHLGLVPLAFVVLHVVKLPDFKIYAVRVPTNVPISTGGF